MSDKIEDLPPEIAAKMMTFLREKDGGGYDLVDKLGLLNFVVEHGEQYPALFSLFKVDREAVIGHVKKKRVKVCQE